MQTPTEIHMEILYTVFLTLGQIMSNNKDNPHIIYDMMHVLAT